MAQPTLSQDLRNRYRWFRQYGGQRAETCLALAKAEAWLREQHDIEPIVTSDVDPDLSWMTDREREQDHTVEIFALVRRCPRHGADCPHAEWLASVGGVVDADSTYGRILFAELASELM